MLIYTFFGKKWKFLILVSLLLNTNLLPSFLQFIYYDSRIGENSINKLSIKPVSTSIRRSSFHPWPFFSGSGRCHMIFLHEYWDCDALGYGYYHTYQSTNGSWSAPKILPESMRTIEKTDETRICIYVTLFDIIPSQNGFTIYYLHQRESAIFSGSISKIEYNEKDNTWSQPVLVFSKNEMRDYLGFEDLSFNSYLHSFYFLNNDSFFVVWSYQPSSNAENNTQPNQDKYILSLVESDRKLIFSVVIWGLETTDQNVRIVERGEAYHLYTQNYYKKAILYSNRTVSNWRDSSIVGNISENLPEVTYLDHKIRQGAYAYTDVYFVMGKKYLIKKAIFLKNYIINDSWHIIDLTEDEMYAKSFVFPYSISSVNRSVIKPVMNSTEGREHFMIAFFTQNAIELWEFNCSNMNFHQISSFMYKAGRYYYQYDEQPIIDLIFDSKENYYIFWDQGEENAKFPLHEIYTVSYNVSSNLWSTVNQITHTKEITDDYNLDCPENSSDGYIILQLIIAVIIVLLILGFFLIFFATKK